MQSPNSKARWWLISGVCGAVVLSVGVAAMNFRAWGAGNHGPASSGESASRSSGPATLGFAESGAKDGSSSVGGLETTRVEVARRSSVLRLTGTLMADERAEVASNASGLVAEVRIDRGSVVRKGDVLVQLDATDAKNHLAEGMAMIEELKVRLQLDQATGSFSVDEQPEVKLAKAAYDLSLSRLRRADKLRKQNVVSAEDFDVVQTEHESALQRYRQAVHQVKQLYQSLQTAKVRFDILRKAVADTSIVAPFDGLVAERRVSVGEYVSGGGPQPSKVVTLVRTDPLRASLVVPQQNIAQIRPGRKVLLRADSFPDKTFEGTVRFISPVVSNDTRSMIVEALVPNAEGQLRPGLFVTAELELPEQRVEMFVPAAAVQRQGDVARVFVIEEGVVRERLVAAGPADDRQRVEIRSGLTGKELLVAAPQKVQDGMRVTK